MKNRKKVLLLLMFISFVLFSSGITYSIFTSGTVLDINNQKIAKFVFNTEKLDHLELSLVDLNPGDSDEYAFSVSNSIDEVLSNITVEYQIVVKTFHLIPLDIMLYKIENEEEVLIMSCDETYSRNEDNELICNSELQEMPYTNEINDNYKLKVSFPRTETIFLALASPIPLNKSEDKNSTIESLVSGIHLS